MSTVPITECMAVIPPTAYVALQMAATPSGVVAVALTALTAYAIEKGIERCLYGYVLNIDRMINRGFVEMLISIFDSALPTEAIRVIVTPLCTLKIAQVVGRFFGMTIALPPTPVFIAGGAIALASLCYLGYVNYGSSKAAAGASKK